MDGWMEVLVAVGSLSIREEVYVLFCCGCKGDAVDVMYVCMYVCMYVGNLFHCSLQRLYCSTRSKLLYHLYVGSILYPHPFSTFRRARSKLFRPRNLQRHFPRYVLKPCAPGFDRGCELCQDVH